VRAGAFRVTFHAISHSTLGARALLVETPAGAILHTGDFKIDETTPEESRFNPAVFEQIGRDGVTLMLSDSTNALHEGHSPGEESVGLKLKPIFERARGRVIVGVFSSHLQRIQQILEAAAATRRKAALSGRSLVENVDLALRLGLIRIPPGVLIPETELYRYAPRDLVIVSTGSQGEMRAVLPRLAREDHPHFKVERGDTVILGARIIPGNERPIYQMINAFSRLGAIVHYGEFSDIQASGHAYADEQRQLLTLIKPRFFVPVHGEYRHLVRHAELAVEVGMPPKNVVIVENGEVLHLSAHQLLKKGVIETGRTCVYGSHMEPAAGPSLKERKALARSGVVAVVYRRAQKRLEILDVRTRGFIDGLPDSDLLRELRGEVAARLAELDRFPEDPERFLELTIRRYGKQQAGRKPQVLLFMVKGSA
jgi:ribonuclease J